jgi:hypothetical protein
MWTILLPTIVRHSTTAVPDIWDATCSATPHSERREDSLPLLLGTSKWRYFRVSDHTSTISENALTVTLGEQAHNRCSSHVRF